MVGHRHQPGLIQQQQLGERAVQRPTQRGSLLLPGGLAGDPGLGEDRRDPIAARDPRHILPDGNNLARSVGAGNQRQGLPWVVLAADHQQVPIVERRGAQADDDLPRARLGIGPVGHAQPLQAKILLKLYDLHPSIL